MSTLHHGEISGFGGSRIREAAVDWWRGTGRWDTWWTLAWFDVVLRYRRSYLGPFWITLSMAATLAILGPLYATLFGLSARTYLPTVTAGFVFWTLVSGCINDGCGAMVAAAGHIRQGQMPPSMVAWRIVARNLIQFVHHLLVFIGVAIWAGIRPEPSMLAAIPGLLLAILVLHCWTLSIGIACARFRDLSQLVPPILQLAFFLTPVLWTGDLLPERARFVLLNPFTVLLDLVRLPLLGQMPSQSEWMVGLVLLATSAAVAAGFSIAQQRRLVYWL
jgi:ABC-type polysaccharide/polyol phosphate export permease